MKILTVFFAILFITKGYTSDDSYRRNPAFLAIACKVMNYNHSSNKSEIEEQANVLEKDGTTEIQIANDIFRQIISQKISPHFYEKARYLRSCCENNKTADPMGWNLAIVLGIQDYVDNMKSSLGENGSYIMGNMLLQLKSELLVALVNAGDKV